MSSACRGCASGRQACTRFRKARAVLASSTAQWLRPAARSITDEGAQLLAAHPAVPQLEYLRLDDNLLSPIGIDALAAVGVTVSERQYFVRGWTDEDELMEDSDLA